MHASQTRSLFFVPFLLAGITAIALAQPLAETTSPVSPPPPAETGETAPGAASPGVNPPFAPRAAEPSSAAGEASRPATVTVNTADTVALIRQSSFAAREQVTAAVQARLDATAQMLVGLEQRGGRDANRSRAELDQALAEVRTREQALRDSLHEATARAKESTWTEIQSTLAKHYGAYAQAVASAEAAAGSALN